MDKNHDKNMIASSGLFDWENLLEFREEFLLGEEIQFLQLLLTPKFGESRRLKNRIWVVWMAINSHFTPQIPY